LDDSKWIIGAQTDQDPEKYYLYNKNDKSITFLFSSRSALEDYQLATMQPVIIKAHDGLDLISYLTLPPNTELNENGRPVQPLPMVLDVHGGPWSRDRWEFTPRHQWLANRGYAVLTVNYRGSSGFGKEFLNAGNREWGGKMHTDLMDGLEWAKTEGIADPERIAIMGGSYGGYAVLWALVESGEHFAAGVGLTGPSNIVTLLEAVPPHLTGMADLFRVRVGDHTTTEGRKLLFSRSPISYPEKISTPLLIAQGANDVRVKRAESDQIVNALVERNIPVTYALFTNEGHGLRRPENRMAFHALTEAFLAQHLGGRHEPLGDILDEASVEILEGSSLIPGIN
jgi:dipeptidyl aminopeptidase/acylaminoacyl peptidase